MRAYCTLFDKNYLFQGVALHDSLKQVAGEFVLYVLCMDTESHQMMMRLKSGSLIPIAVEEIQTPEISAVRAKTTHGQFCWVCQPLMCEFVLGRSDHEMVTYLEADSLFFSDPEVLFREFGAGSVSLVSHSYSPGFDNTIEAGRFCVQFNVFRRDAQAKRVLDYWKSCCFKYSKEKPFVYPGQTSLDAWPKIFENVKILEHPGAGVAPWNIQHRKIGTAGGIPTVDGVPIVFYHYHQYGRCENGSHELGSYPLTDEAVGSIYRPYAEALAVAEMEVRSLEPEFRYRRTYPDPGSLGQILCMPTAKNASAYVRSLKRKVRGTFNVVPDHSFRTIP